MAPPRNASSFTSAFPDKRFSCFTPRNNFHFCLFLIGGSEEGGWMELQRSFFSPASAPPFHGGIDYS